MMKYYISIPRSGYGFIHVSKEQKEIFDRLIGMQHGEKLTFSYEMMNEIFPRIINQRYIGSGIMEEWLAIRNGTNTITQPADIKRHLLEVVCEELKLTYEVNEIGFYTFTKN